MIINDYITVYVVKLWDMLGLDEFEERSNDFQ